VTAPTLDLAILQTLAKRPNHGFGIALHIQEASHGLLMPEEGSLYPALHRMEKAGWLAAEWKATENSRRARWYRLTPEGRQRLTDNLKTWQTLARGLQLLLEES
jgi:transcriptional regulator